MMEPPIVDTHLPYKPVPKGRPRATSRGGKIVLYTPQRTVDFEDLIRDHLGYVVKARPNGIDQFSVRATFHTTSSVDDIDNYLKSLFDACNGIVWDDDRQVVALHAYIKRLKKAQTGIDFRVTKARTSEESFNDSQLRDYGIRLRDDPSAFKEILCELESLGLIEITAAI